MSTTYWEERRRDRQAEREERRRDRQQEWEQRRRDREDRRRRRAEQMARLRGWARDVAAQAPWLVIMGAPMVMSWAAMAAYGMEIYGGIGILLPLFSEASLLVFALAAARAAKEGQPTALLRLGVAVFGAVAAALNFIHGLEGGAAHGLVMAVVSVGGVAVHQLVHGRPPRPRRTWQQRQEARLQRQAQRRVYRLRRAAIRSATPVLRADGSVSLVYSPGALEERRWLGRTRVETVPAPVETVADEVELWLAAGAPGTGGNTTGTAETRSSVATLERPEAISGTVREQAPAPAEPTVPMTRLQELAARVVAAIEAGQLPAQPSRSAVQRYLHVRAGTARQVMQYLGLGGDR